MQVFKDIKDFAASEREVALALGSFDGVHRGHQELIGRMVEWSRRNGALSVVLTFDPHPLWVLQPNRAPSLLTAMEQKIRLIAGLGADCIVIQSFDTDFALLTPRQFVKNVLVSEMGASRVFVGHDYRFGHRACGDTELLTALGEEYGLRIEALPAVMHRGEVVSSTRIREFVRQGRMERAANFLGHPFVIGGEVTDGDGRARNMGYPTANIIWPEVVVRPQRGVYAVRVYLDGVQKNGIANIGVRPTFKSSPHSVSDYRLEVHIFDFADRIYGRYIEVAICKQIRQERRFSDSRELLSQIQKDIVDAKRILSV